MNENQKAILETIHSHASTTKPYTTSQTLAESLGWTLEAVEEQLEMMETNGLVRLARTEEAGQWEARLTPQGRRQIGEPDFPTDDSEGTAARKEKGHAGAVDKAQIAAVEAVTANVQTLDQEGEQMIGEALSQMASAITASDDLPEEQRAELLEVTETLSGYAVARARGEKQERDVIIPLLTRLRDGMMRASPLAKNWATWEPIVTEYFEV
ncbi:MAG: EAP30/Vps36 family vacuolar-sorting protein [Chloroflexota bacterium]|nr:EAP30/Vps36 family vacuolar-sorting protein [Chloroflexota bacterium]